MHPFLAFEEIPLIGKNVSQSSIWNLEYVQEAAKYAIDGDVHTSTYTGKTTTNQQRRSHCNVQLMGIVRVALELHVIVTDKLYIGEAIVTVKYSVSANVRERFGSEGR